ncbi:DUF1827 family protein [Enterococcus asini]|uniref:DUF1827 family protein n=1 Tax=Enterococcus asini TaxID=57732 RepID=UPI0013873CDC|nr:DUF1827 family protein [Enterococcus asini]MCD5029053.1 DUF1827 family protein [Enterococcus asini]MDT2783892.1 DUF1827 family protein [Enterococcus asini]
MKLINVTNSHSRLVRNQLENTDAEMVKVYTAGNTTVIFTAAPTHDEIVIVNKKRNLLDKEIQEIQAFFFKKMTTKPAPEFVTIIRESGLVEISIQKPMSNVSAS